MSTQILYHSFTKLLCPLYRLDFKYKNKDRNRVFKDLILISKKLARKNGSYITWSFLFKTRICSCRIDPLFYAILSRIVCYLLFSGGEDLRSEFRNVDIAEVILRNPGPGGGISHPETLIFPLRLFFFAYCFTLLMRRHLRYHAIAAQQSRRSAHRCCVTPLFPTVSPAKVA